ncbi:MAG TPA: efflux RND transporter periplasmic adaptor subunit [Alloacidobacterium sp.]|nr:efflux RND transporter periplasmic adaptor subunit [Alloacidobacterium sp.]
MDQESPKPIPPDHQLPRATENPPSPPKKGRQWLWVLLLIAFAIVLYLILTHHSTSQQAAGGAGGGRRGFGGPVTLTATTAEKGDIGVYRDAIGTVTPVYTASIYNQVAGVVTAVHYREGQTVRKGDPLVDIDPRQYQAQVESAEGALQRDTNLLAQAKMDLARYEDAWKRNAIAKQQLDDQEKVVAQDEGLVRSDQGTLDYDKVQLSYCHIVAPFTGRVGLRLVDPGNLVQASGSTVLAVITQVQPITVVFTIAQDFLPDILDQLHHGAKLSVDAYDREQSKKLATGRLLALDNQIDTTTGTLKFRAQFDNRDGNLYPNQFVNVRLLVSTEHGVTLIPSSAIQHNGQVSFVYVIADGKAEVKNVQPGITDHGMTAVTGINPGDQLATSSFEKLQNGSKVNISKQPVLPDTTESIAP